jgi:transposase
MPKLTDRQAQTVLSWFTQSPREFGYSTDLWTSRRVRDLVQKTFGVAFNSNYICEWLTGRRVTPQKPKRQPRQRDQARIDDWVRNDWPRLVKKGANAKPILC